VSGEHIPPTGAATAGAAGRVDEVCDRFEAAFKAGQDPRIEDYMGDVNGPEGRHLLRELLALDLELRRRRGESPRPEEYRPRLPGHAALIDAVFGAAGEAPAPAPQPGPADQPPGRADVGRSLLLGLLAFHNNFIGGDSLRIAFTDWVADKARPLGRILVDRGMLDASRHALLSALVEEHLRQHGGDAERSLVALGSLGAAARHLEPIPDTDLQDSLGRIAPGRGEGRAPDETLTYPGRSGLLGGRFRVLRPHARGGLGEVSVAEDRELDREVALKEIRARHAHDPGSRARFFLEAKITGGLEHPGVVPIYSLGTDADGRSTPCG
jgi:hypothetical protein